MSLFIDQQINLVRWQQPISVGLMLLASMIPTSADAKSSWQLGSGSQYIFDSNYFKTNVNPKAEHTFKLTPNAKFSVSQKRSLLNINYAGDFGFNLVETQENQLDHKASTGINIKFGSVSSLSFLTGYTTSRDVRGLPTTPTNNSSNLPSWSGKSVSSTLTTPFVSKSALRFSGKFMDRTYDSNFSGSSRNIIDLALTNVIPVTFKTSFQIQYAFQTTSFHENSASDSQSHRITGGMTWKTTGKTTSFAHFGLETNSAIQNDKPYTGIYANIKFRWKRKSYSYVDLSLSRKNTDSGNIVDGQLVSNNSSINWKHKYNFQWNSNIAIATSYDQFSLGRRDISISPSIGFNFRKSKHLSYLSRISVNGRQSNNAANNFNNYILSVGLSYSGGRQ